MKDLFIEGGATFMSILTLLFVIMLAWMITHVLKHLKSNKPDVALTLRKIEQGRAVGLFALIVGLLGQLIGLYVAFNYISNVGEVSPKIMFSGIKVSMITTLYGMIIYLISIVLWFGARQLIDKKS